MKILILLTIVIFLGVLSMTIKNLRVPAAVGLKEGRLSPLPSSPNGVSSLAEEAEKRVAPLPFAGSGEETRAAIKRALEQYGNIEVLEDRPDYIHAVHTTGKMRYRDDLEFHLKEQEKQVEFRSASRVGYSDMGLNRKRYEELLRLYR